MARQLTFYIVFHKDLFPSNTAAFTVREINDIFTWVAVNSTIPKKVPAQMARYPMICEYRMRFYNPSLQASNFYQNSVFFHLYKNPEHLQSKFVGFGQYDMKFDRSAIPATLLDNHVYGYFPYDNEAVWNLMPITFWQSCFLDPYNRHHGTTHTFDDLSKYPFYMYHTFILPTSFFMRIMPFVEKNLNTIISGLHNNSRHLAGTLERIFALCITCGLVEGALKGHVTLGGVSHLAEQHTEDALRGIAKIGPA